MSTSIWIKRRLNKIHESIAFVPALVVLFFLVLSALMIYLDYSETGKDLKASTEWIRLKDPSTARALVSVIAAGLISLTVFSFSMVMVVLNQAASQLSNRVLDNLVGNRFHQFIIGFYIGDIIFSLLLLTSIRDIESGVYVPALSTYLLIFLSVIAIFLFVIFLHFITQTIKYTTIIWRIYRKTLATMKETCSLNVESDIIEGQEGQPVFTNKVGVFETFDRQELIDLAKKNNCVIKFRYWQGHFILENVPIADVICMNGSLSKELEGRIMSHISLVDDPSVDIYFYSGFKQLSEIAIKALSPGINDSGTAAESLQALFALLAYRRNNFPEIQLLDEEGLVRIIAKEMSFDEIFHRYILPVWDYGREDRTIRTQMIDLLQQLQYIGENATAGKLLMEIQASSFREAG